MSTGPAVDLSEFDDLSENKRSQCGVAVALEALENPEDRRNLAAALAQPMTRIQHSAISTWLKRRGKTVGADAIGRHRRKQCACKGPQDDQ